MNLVDFLAKIYTHSPAELFIAFGQVNKPLFLTIGEILSETEFNIDQDKNIFITPGAFSKPERTKTTAVGSSVAWVDYDTYKQDGLQSLLPPTIIVNSGKGHHYYYALDRFYPADEIEKANKVLLAHLSIKSDGCWEASRLLRLPGSTNNKYLDPRKAEEYKGPLTCDVVEHNPDAVYSLDDLLHLLPYRKTLLTTPAKDGKVDRSARDHKLTKTLAEWGLSEGSVRLALLYHSDKAGDRPDYVELTVAKAIAPIKAKAGENYLISLGVDDNGNAEAVGIRYAGKFAHNDAYGWLTYTGTHWMREGAESVLDRAIVETIQARANEAVKTMYDRLQKFSIPNAGKVQGCRTEFQHIVYVPAAKFSGRSDMLNCANGVVNLRTGEVVAHEPGQFFMYCLPIEYHPTKSSDDWINFLAEVVGHYDEIAEYLQTAVGYSLTGETTEEILFYIYGPRRAGKGTFASTLLAMLGKPICDTADFATFTAERDGDSNNFDLAGWQQTRFIIASENDRHTRLSAKRIKTITGGDEIRASYKYGDHFSYKPQYKLWLQSNWPVNADPDDDAIWGRVKVIHFPKTYYGIEDKTLKYRLAQADNLEGVLAWAVAGAIRWFSLETGLKEPAAITATTEAQRTEQDTVGQFLAEMWEATENPNDFICNPEFYEAYVEYCGELGTKPKGLNQLTQSLRSKGIKAGETKRIGNRPVRGVAGLKWKGTRQHEKVEN